MPRLEGRGRHLNLYGRLTDVLDTDQRFAAAALAYREAVDELAGIYSLRLQRALDSVYAVQRRTVRRRPRRVGAERTAYGSFRASTPGTWRRRPAPGRALGRPPRPSDSEPMQRHRAEVAEAIGQAARWRSPAATSACCCAA